MLLDILLSGMFALQNKSPFNNNLKNQAGINDKPTESYS